VVTFQIQEQDGQFSQVSHKEFYETLNNGDGYLYYNSGGRHMALLPTATNEETIRICRQADNAENYGFASSNRCLDAKGRLCRYQHDENGSVIRNKAGNPVSAKCSECPRDGWIAGKRENCCIRKYCKTEDCTYCTKQREYHAPISLEWLTEDKHDLNETDGAGFYIADPDADIQAVLESDELNSALHIAVSQLPLNEQIVLKAIYWDKLTRRGCSAETGIALTTVNRLHDRALKALKNILKNYC